MITETTITFKIEEKDLAEATAILDKAGLPVSKAVRMVLEEIVRAKYFYLAPPPVSEDFFQPLEDDGPIDGIYGAANLDALLRELKLDEPPAAPEDPLPNCVLETLRPSKPPKTEGD